MRDTMSDRVTLNIPNGLEELPRVQQEAEALLSRHDVDAGPAYTLRLCLEELVSNVIRHAYDDAGRHDIRIRIIVNPEEIELTVEDDGRPFDPNGRPDLQTPDSLEHAPTGGMGLVLVTQMVGPIQYMRDGDRNRSTIKIKI